MEIYFNDLEGCLKRTFEQCLSARKHFPCFHTVIEIRVEVWTNEKFKWDL